MKKVVIAIDSFKACLTSSEVGQAAEEGVKAVFPACEVIKLPIADGGEGILDVLMSAGNGTYCPVRVHDPLMQMIDSRYGISSDGETAWIEMATASGLPLVPVEKRNPLLTTTFGTGELIKNGLERGCRDFIVGIGGSATNDAGLGMLQALGFRFLDKHGQALEVGGQIMGDVASIDISSVHPALQDAQFTIACDVHNPFCGPEGAAFVFARQKGASAEMIEALDAGMHALAKVIFLTTGKDILPIPGAGAAGGLGGGFLAFLNATLKPGIELLLETLNFEEKLTGADLVITGEGRVDRQTAMGKVPWGILRVAKKKNVPVIVIAGGIEDVPEMNQAGFQGVFSITPGPVSLEKAMEPDFAKENVSRLVSQICYTIRSLK